MNAFDASYAGASGLPSNAAMEEIPTRQPEPLCSRCAMATLAIAVKPETLTAMVSLSGSQSSWGLDQEFGES